VRVTRRWLEDFVDIPLTTKELVERLDFSGTKVESVATPGEGITGVEVAEVLSIEQHPNADTLTLVEVKRGNGTSQRVVCGARNFSVGDRVPLATVGATLRGTTISQRKIRGIASAGMLCSGAELGVSGDHAGILVLPPDVELGGDVAEALELNDTVLELEITLNRPDCMSIIGIAREISAITGAELREPEDGMSSSGSTTVPEAPPADKHDAAVRVRIDDPQGCPRYLARYIEGVSVAPSPRWVTSRLLACGVRPISNVVDVTNYVLLELGHPLHAFDAARVGDRTIVVRRAEPGERLTTLDGVTRDLDPDDLMIADPSRCLGIAGIMGGEDSEVGTQTNNVVLEAAYFDPESIAFTARRHLMRTEASARFELGMDPVAPPSAAARAARLIASLADGRAAPEVVDDFPRPPERPHIRLRPQRTNHVLGITIGRDEQIARLRAIQVEVDDSDEVLSARPPSFRPDLEREIDLVEEVGRLHGLQDLPSTLPPGAAGGLEDRQSAERRLRSVLVDLGIYEAWTPSLASESDPDLLGLDPDHPARRAVLTWNPMAEDEKVMRTMLIPSLLRAVAGNQARHVDDVALFEIARTYHPTEDVLPAEELRLSAVLSGRRVGKQWGAAPDPWDFFSAKGVLEALFASQGIPAPAFAPSRVAPFHPTRAADVIVAGTAIGIFGELHPDVLERFDVHAGSVAFELALAPVFAALPDRVQAVPPPRFPATFMDLAVVVDDEVPATAVAAVIVEAGAPEVASARLFDLYRGDQVGEGKKSLAYALELRAPDRTMTDEKAASVRDRIVPALAKAVGGGLRA
jgi:phenylalanyl-tRNA synthetase beta chain